ncbi:type I methionyl aminopeptidase [Clostridium tyrobutyricum]|uniref:type I methionyl aminopeptidase n=1 Tax=Clostridium tyrobutyricum TaxID=1519 RepID=UPI001C38B9C9|nr:type I methionyl aminopeptidase [Clostridium tyrobutyricum]MBV4428962.1 type I methionyl aminopeptidase [Clostridium tyrobutyricum]MBV4444294.1 type I methionyl aminopeptidase [Clostridium tyrobutyricum]
MIIIKTNREIEFMKRSGRVVSDTLEKIYGSIKPGITTYELDKIADEYIRSQNAIPSFKGYCQFPASICTSVNDEVVHGLPSKNKILMEGDIISIDCGAILDGYHGGAARTFPVGNVSKEAQSLIDTAKESFFKGVEQAIVGNKLTDISHAIQQYAESLGYSVIRDYVGHGIGRDIHEEPEIPNFGAPGRGPKLIKGMCLAVEPMISIGKHNVKVRQDNWTVVTVDGSLSAHYENTIAILENGAKIITLDKQE